MNITALKKAAVAVLAVGAATVIALQQREISRLRVENRRLVSEKRVPLRSPANATAAAKIASANDLDRLRAELDHVKSTPAATWQDRAALLKDVLSQLPEQSIPEISLATDEDWLDAARGKLETADDYRKALAKLRNLAVARFVQMLRPALQQYAAANDGKFPDSPGALERYLVQRIDPAIWSRYVVGPANLVPNIGVGEQIITQAWVVDPRDDTEYAVGPRGMGQSTFGAGLVAALERAYRKANGTMPADPSALLAYATTDRERAAVKGAMDRFEAARSSGKTPDW